MDMLTRYRDTLLLVTLTLMLLVLPGCDLVGGILKFGFWVGVIVLIVIIAIIWAIVRFVRRKV